MDSACQTMQYAFNRNIYFPRFTHPFLDCYNLEMEKYFYDLSPQRLRSFESYVNETGIEILVNVIFRLTNG